jgi:Protein of unknown function (DUF2380)
MYPRARISFFCRPTIRLANMRNSRALVHLAAMTAALAAIGCFGSAAANSQDSCAAIAVFDFNYVDTSGEERDQRREHAARLAAFMSALKADLAAQGRFCVVVPACRPEPCSLAALTPDNVLAAAREAGASLVLIGNIHKMSTLVQWANVKAIDVKTGQEVLAKLFTFRGDTDEAWARAERFIATEIKSIEPPP